MRILILLLLFLSIISSPVKEERKSKLSEYGFFQGRMADLNPAEGVVPYSINAPLFSNYSEKARFLFIPKDSSFRFNDSTVFDFPSGTVLIKNFFYPTDFRNPGKGRRIIETRLLVKTGDSWEAFPYVWNDEQTDAFYEPAGDIKDVSYVNASGKQVHIGYVVPNKNQCKGCHVRNQTLLPIGTTAMQLNRSRPGGPENQLAHLAGLGLLRNLHLISTIPKLPEWENSSESVANRARSYLHGNCAHCHSRSGPASTSGLFLNFHEVDPAHLGISKTPVAAGRGSGNLQFDIVPGSPDKSILIYRMKATDPAVAMPELGREQLHPEGIRIVEAWIRSLGKS